MIATFKRDIIRAGDRLARAGQSAPVDITRTTKAPPLVALLPDPKKKNRTVRVGIDDTDATFSA